jgi:hypothetical protein
MCIFIMHPVVLVLAGMSASVLNVPEGCEEGGGIDTTKSAIFVVSSVSGCPCSF